jgi:hypothetical protein
MARTPSPTPNPSSTSLLPEVEGEGDVACLDLRGQRRTLLDLIRTNEMLKRELKRQRNKLLSSNQDQYFLFERLRNHEKCPALQPRQRQQLNREDKEGGSQGRRN